MKAIRHLTITATFNSILIAVCLGSLVGCNWSIAHSASSETKRGAIAFKSYGCGACHYISGNNSAIGIVGPSLVDMSKRVYIGRGLPNTPQNMVRWIRMPQQFAPGSAMPDLHVTLADAQDISAYLYSLK